MRAVVQVFSDMFEDEVDLYWLSTRFMKCLDQSATQTEKLVTVHFTMFSVIVQNYIVLRETGVCVILVTALLTTVFSWTIALTDRLVRFMGSNHLHILFTLMCLFFCGLKNWKNFPLVIKCTNTAFCILQKRLLG